MFVKTMSYALAFDTVIFITFLLLCSFQRAILLRYFPICFVAALKKFRQRRLLRFLTFRSRASHLEKSLRIILPVLNR